MVTVAPARLLLPEDYGIVAMATSVVAMADMFKTMGLVQVLIQSRDAVLDEASDVMFWSNVVIASVLMLGVCLIAPSGRVLQGAPPDCRSPRAEPGPPDLGAVVRSGRPVAEGFPLQGAGRFDILAHDGDGGRFHPLGGAGLSLLVAGDRFAGEHGPDDRGPMGLLRLCRTSRSVGTWRCRCSPFAPTSL